MKGLFRIYTDDCTYHCNELIFAFEDISEAVIKELIKETDLSEDKVYMLLDDDLDCAEFQIQFIKIIEG